MIRSPQHLRSEAEAAAAALPALILSAERLAAALSIGSHGLRRAGMGEEFWQYRPASDSDSARSIDWRRSARSDGQFVRDREAQIAQSVALWVSNGQGMAYSGGPDRPTKRARAEILALALAMALLRGGEKVGLLGQMPRAGRVLQADTLAAGLLARPEIAPGDDEDPPLAAIRPGQRLIIIGDFLGEPEPILAFLKHAASLGVRGALLQLLDPDEESFPFTGAVLFRTPSGAVSHDTRDAAGLRKAYLARLAERRARLTEACQASGWQFGTHDTASAAATALLWLAAVLEG